MKRRIAIEDIVRVRTVSNAQISPDGKRVAYTVRTPDELKYASHLWVDGEAFTSGKVSDAGHRWSPDGRWIAFVRTVDEASQVHVLSMSGGESRALTTLEPGSAGGIDWSPDGRKISFIYRRSPRFADNKKESKIPVARHITDLWYKVEAMGHWDGSRHEVLTVDWDGRVTNLGEASEAKWSPDGKLLAFARVLGPGGESEIGIIDGDKRRLLPKPKGSGGSLSWSPNGRFLAYLGHDHPEETWGSRNTHVWVIPIDGGAAKDVTAGFDRTCSDVTLNDLKAAHGDGQAPIWSSNGESIYFLASDRGASNVYRVSGGKVEAVTHERAEIMNFTIGGNRAAATVCTTTVPADVFTFELGGTLRRLTNVNRELLDEVDIAEPEELKLPNDVQGWMLKPPDFDRSRKYPLALEIHGGPRTQYGWTFFHEFQVLAAQGYCVLYANPRGSQGYGESFARSIRGDWGNLDYQDLMAAVDHAVGLGYIDEKRMAVMGGSYGGYMTSWVIGHTNRFRAAVSMRAVNNWISFAGTSDIGSEAYSEAMAHPWENMERLWAMSPIAYVKNVSTPLLILHSAGDLRCPLEQAEQMFTFLKQQGKDVEMVVFPEENHDLSRAGRPDRRLERLRHIVRFLQKHL
jgi:dipeptidyl aminopeptidase/acylaminoacyl peptidase